MMIYCVISAHILFDDAMELNADKAWVPNQFVKSLISVIDEAARYEGGVFINFCFKTFNEK